MSKLSKLEEVALNMAHAQVVAGYEEIRMIQNFRDAHNFLKISSEQFKDSGFNKPDLKEIKVMGHVEVKKYDLNSHVVSAAEIANCLNECNRELNEKQVLSPVHSMIIVSNNFTEMARKKIQDLNNGQFNG